MKQLVLSFIVVLIVVVIFESGLRISGIYYTYPERNFGKYTSLFDQEKDAFYFMNRVDSFKYEQEEFNYHCDLNDIGLRTNIDLIADHSDKHRILFLGDSFTEGVGASCGANMVEELHKYAAVNLDLINCGVLGSDPFLQTLWYDSLFRFFNPDEVVMILNYSDIGDYIVRGGNERFVGDSVVLSKSAPGIEPFYRKSHLVRFLTHFVFRYDYTFTPKAKLPELSRSILVNYANHINDWKKAHPEFDLYLVVHPYPYAYDKTVAGHNEIPKIGEHLSAEIQFINLYPQFDEVLDGRNYLQYSWKQDGHFNDRGYAIFAELLAPYLDLTRD